MNDDVSKMKRKYSAKHQAPKSRRKNSIVLLLFCLLFLVGGGFAFWGQGMFLPQNPSESSSAVPEATPDKNSIAIPGYEGLTLKADTKRQEISLKNPAENNCCFIITLYLEDGEELWRSDYIKAGDVSKPINLNRKLSAGSYSAKLKYDCFALNKEKTPLNGAEIKLTLRVK